MLDALTADNPAVLVSLGGTPRGMKHSVVRNGDIDEQSDVEKGESTRSQSRPPSAARQRAGSIHL